MDRYVVKEPRTGADYPQGNQISFAPNSGHNNMIPQETMYFGGYGAEFPNMQHVNNTGFMGPGVTHNAPFALPNHFQGQVQNQILSGIDSRYLAAYSDNNASFIAGQQRQQISREQNPQTQHAHNHQTQHVQNMFPNGPAFPNEYQNRNFSGADRTKNKAFVSQMTPSAPMRYELRPNIVEQENSFINNNQQNQLESKKKAHLPVTVKQPTLANNDSSKNEFHSAAKTKLEMRQALYKSGGRAFSGPVDKVLKWHKALQDIGVLVLYEIVAKCVNVRAGESCAKNLVVRDDNGPAIQVVYYEIDFLLPELKPPCTVRVLGRMMPGTCRLQAFSVRPATGDDVATLPRRAAVAAHHVAKLCKEYNSIA